MQELPLYEQYKRLVHDYRNQRLFDRMRDDWSLKEIRELKTGQSRMGNSARGIVDRRYHERVPELAYS